ncbi:unnamed protein product, partial [Laminaria digitata]
MLTQQIITAAQGKNGQDGGFSAVIANAKMFRLEGRKQVPNLASLEDALPQASKNKFNGNGPMVAFELMVDGQQGGFASLQDVVDRLRQRHGGGGVFASKTPDEAAEHARWVFQGGGGMSPAPHACCTLCVVRPHVVRDGGLGAVLSFVAERGFQVTELQMIWLGETAAEELLLPYRGVLACHGEAVRHLKSGPSVALRIEGGDDVVEEFREACGPADPEIARALYPKSIRALLGVHQ